MSSLAEPGARVATLCEAPRHGDEEVDAEIHARLCGPCRRGLARDLRRLPGLHADLRLLAPGMRALGRGTGEGLPFNEPAAEARDQIRHDLTYWTMQVTADRGLDAPPPLEGDNWAANPVAAMCGWLCPQVTWCSFREWAPDMAGAVRDVTGRAVALLDPMVTKRFAIPAADGLCLACGQVHVTVTVYASDNDKRRSFIACPACGQRWEPEQWMRYGQQVVRRREAMAS